VELHGGTIEARSLGRNRGSIFTVYLPSAIELSSPTLPQPSAPAIPAPSSEVDPTLLHGLRVLVVDDQEDARAMMQATLSQYGADVATADSAAAALAAIEDRCPDVVLSDIGMPHDDGYALIRRVRQLPPGRGSLVPAIAITAYASGRDRHDALAAGYQEHIAKPFNAGELASLVARLGHAPQRS
jgi:CheY-like chemotaxis protein